AMNDEVPEIDESERKRATRQVLLLLERESNPIHWKAFWLMGIEEKSAADAAKELRVTENVVYLARSRLQRRLREELVAQFPDLVPLMYEVGTDMNCPRPETWCAFAFGRQAESEEEALAQHLTQCARCRETLDGIDFATDDLTPTLRAAAVEQGRSEWMELI